MSHGVPRVSSKRDDERDRKSIDDYQALVQQVNAQMQAQEYTSDTLALTSRLLSINPEFYTAWNHRRKLLSHLMATSAAPGVDLITADLAFLIPLLKLYPKCYWLWNYRIWLLEQAELYAPKEALAIWRGELALVAHMLTRDERNFHGWGYRRRVVMAVERLEGTSLAEEELVYTGAAIRRALQNFSAFHYRSKLLGRVLDERGATDAQRRRVFDNELDISQEALVDPFNQSAWFYHQFLMRCVVEQTILRLTTAEKAAYFESEMARVEEMLEDYDDCKWIYQALLQYAMEFHKLRPEAVACSKLQSWLSHLRRLDPLRAGRWADLETTL
ncbi:protein prenylyltransferase [Trichodelitschia bisporula]|uniref:Geranylgeranyl transferase type-2 subunit alpha n=1 Tax=Trichodelitschia bisporula TaxID=703511 RepID=A0A6G1I4P7_9PEZI|nr:protein prenylyltransferase [Trichodelitschia bisporula]